MTKTVTWQVKTSYISTHFTQKQVNFLQHKPYLGPRTIIFNIRRHNWRSWFIDKNVIHIYLQNVATPSRLITNAELSKFHTGRGLTTVTTKQNIWFDFEFRKITWNIKHTYIRTLKFSQVHAAAIDGEMTVHKVKWQVKTIDAQVASKVVDVMPTENGY